MHILLILAAVLSSAVPVLSAPSDSNAWAARLNDVTHSFEFGGDNASDLPRLVAWNKGVHIDDASGESFQLYTLDQHQTPHEAIHNYRTRRNPTDEKDIARFRAKRDFKDGQEALEQAMAAKMHSWHPANPNIRNDTSPGGPMLMDNFVPLRWREWDCEEDMPCANDLSNEELTGYNDGLTEGFCRPWQYSARRDSDSWEWKYAYHQCGAKNTPYDWMFRYGMRNTSSLLLELLTLAFGHQDGRSHHKPRSICLDDHDMARICLSWDAQVGADSYKNVWLTPDDMLVLRDMHMMCLHNGYSAAGEIKVQGNSKMNTVCYSNRPSGCYPEVCYDRYKIRYLPTAPEWMGNIAINKMLMGGDKKGPRMDVYAQPQRVPFITNSINKRIPFILHNDTLKWLFENQTTPDNPHGFWGPEYDPSINWPHPGGQEGESWCTTQDWPGWIWCRGHKNMQKYEGQYFDKPPFDSPFW